MKYAVGLDHIIYGWLFYGVVMLSFFWIGSYWGDRSPSAQASDRVEPAVAKAAVPTAVAAAGLVALVGVWPLYAAYLDRPDVHPVGFAAPAGAAGWMLEAEVEPAWSPEYAGPVATVLVKYRKGERSVWLYSAHFRNQRQGAELVSSQNLLAGGKDAAWSVIGTAARAQSLRSADVKVRETRLRSAGRRLLVWDWYWIAGRNVGDPYLAKVLLARDKLLGRGDASSAIVIAAPYEARAEDAVATLRAFLGDMLPAVEAAVALAARGQPG
jgi:EpsI family protein